MIRSILIRNVIPSD